MILNRKAAKCYIKSVRADVRITTEYLEKLEGKIRHMIDLDLELPANKKSVKDTWPLNGH